VITSLCYIIDGYPSTSHGPDQETRTSTLTMAEKEVVRVVMVMPRELTLDLDHHDVVTVERRYGPR
jgi:hypothetical protein